MPKNQIEIFSLESAVMDVFAITLAIMAISQALGYMFPVMLKSINDRFDAFIEWVHGACEVLPWLCFAALVATVTPIYDIFLDGAWLNSVSSQAARPQTMLDVWRTMVSEQSEANSQRDLVHGIQWIVALFMFYIYSILWVRFVSLAVVDMQGQSNKLVRGAFFGGFAGVIGYVSDFVSGLGQTADFVLL